MASRSSSYVSTPVAPPRKVDDWTPATAGLSDRASSDGSGFLGTVPRVSSQSFFNGTCKKKQFSISKSLKKAFQRGNSSSSATEITDPTTSRSSVSPSSYDKSNHGMAIKDVRIFGGKNGKSKGQHSNSRGREFDHSASSLLSYNAGDEGIDITVATPPPVRYVTFLCSL